MIDTIKFGRTKFFHTNDNISLLQQVAKIYKTGKLQVINSSSSWVFFLEEGYVYYAVSSSKNWEQFVEKIQVLAQTNSTIKSQIQQKLRNQISTGVEEDFGYHNYLAICWLVEQQYITIYQAEKILEEITKETINSFLQVREGISEFSYDSSLRDMPKFSYVDIQQIWKKRNQIGLRERFSANIITSTSQVPQLIIASRETDRDILFAEVTQQELIEQEQNIEKTLAPQVNSPLHADELTSPVYSNERLQPQLEKIELIEDRNSINPSKDQEQNKSEAARKLYKVLCIDDSPLILKAIRGYLDEQIFHVVGVDDSLKALVEILRHKPDVILLDISMPNLDGYELCSLLRKHAKFQDTPIIMVTGRRGFIDKARAKLVKASGYLTKPFSKAELLKILFQNLAGLGQ